MNVNENISSDVIVLLFDDHVEEILFHALMEDSGNDCLTLYDLQENENLQTYNIPDEDCFFNSVYPASPTQFPQNRGDNLQVRADESSELQNRCQLFMKIFNGSNKKRATSQKRKQHEAVQQDYKRIMNSFVRILPKPQVENGEEVIISIVNVFMGFG